MEFKFFQFYDFGQVLSNMCQGTTEFSHFYGVFVSIIITTIYTWKLDIFKSITLAI
jgi:hypothetical protein